MKTRITDILASLLILLFVYAAVSKLIDYGVFKTQIQQSPFIGWFSPVAWLLPLAELATAGLLLWKPLQKFGFYASAFLMASFTIYIAAMLLFATHLPCSCGGVLKQLSWKQHLVFNVCFLLITIIGIKILRNNKNIVATYRQPDQPPREESRKPVIE